MDGIYKMYLFLILSHSSFDKIGPTCAGGLKIDHPAKSVLILKSKKTAFFSACP